MFNVIMANSYSIARGGIFPFFYLEMSVVVARRPIDWDKEGEKSLDHAAANIDSLNQY